MKFTEAIVGAKCTAPIGYGQEPATIQAVEAGERPSHDPFAPRPIWVDVEFETGATGTFSLNELNTITDKAEEEVSDDIDPFAD